MQALLQQMEQENNNIIVKQACNEIKLQAYFMIQRKDKL